MVLFEAHAAVLQIILSCQFLTGLDNSICCNGFKAISFEQWTCVARTYLLVAVSFYCCLVRTADISELWRRGEKWKPVPSLLSTAYFPLVRLWRVGIDTTLKHFFPQGEEGISWADQGNKIWSCSHRLSKFYISVVQTGCTPLQRIRTGSRGLVESGSALWFAEYMAQLTNNIHVLCFVPSSILDAWAHT